MILVTNHGEYGPVMSWKETVAARRKRLHNRPRWVATYPVVTKPQHVKALAQRDTLTPL